MQKKYVFVLVVFVFILSGFVYKQIFTRTFNVAPVTDSQEASVLLNSTKPQVKNSNALDLSNKNLRSIPSYVFSQTNLEELNVSDNSIGGAFQGEIRHLQNLRILDASNNVLTGVPAEVGQLQNLEVLDLSNNKLTGLPYELGNLKKLKVLNLSGNTYSTQDLEIITKNLPSDVEIIL